MGRGCQQAPIFDQRIILNIAHSLAKTTNLSPDYHKTKRYRRASICIMACRRLTIFMILTPTTA